MLRTLKITATDPAATIRSTMSDTVYGTGVRLKDGVIKNVGSNPATISSGAVDGDDTSVLIGLAAGQSLPFSEINLSDTYVYSASGTTLDIYGDE